jgi:hypothetical protein
MDTNYDLGIKRNYKPSINTFTKMSEQQKIEAIAHDIQNGIYGWTQKCGTEWQKWTYSLMQAKKIYEGDLIISLSIENE